MVNDADERAKVTFLLESQYRAIITEVAHAEEAIMVLKEKGSQFDLIVSDWTKSIQELDSFFESTRKIKQTPCIFAVSSKHSKELADHPLIVGKLDRDRLLTGLQNQVGELIKSGKLADVNPDADSNFVRIRTRILLTVAPLRGDIFIRLSEAKYLKIMQEGDTFDQEDLEKYTHKKGIDYLYLRKEQTAEFIEKYRKELEKAGSDPTLDIDKVAKNNDSVYDTIQELGARVGVNREVQALAKTQVKNAMKAMGGSPSMKGIFDRLESFKGQYIGSHSLLTGFLASAIASKLEWGSATTFHKLSMAAFLHDITLSNHELAKCETIQQAKDGPFTTQEKQMYEKHPMHAAEVAKRFNEIPPDVDQIILQSHERPDSTGFPRRLSHSYISSLSTVFIVAHELADRALAALERGEGKSFTPAAYLAEVRDQYSSSGFRKVLSALENIQIP